MSNTPGPWAYELLPDGSHIISMPFESGSPGWVGAEVFARRDGDHIANARLIAAAPELLEALKRLVAVVAPMPDVGPVYDDAVRAIAKAEEEP